MGVSVNNPCGDLCPAVTGEPIGSLTVCPMESPDSFNLHRAEHTDCCADFRCCLDLWKEAGLVGLADQIAATERDREAE